MIPLAMGFVVGIGWGAWIGYRAGERRARTENKLLAYKAEARAFSATFSRDTDLGYTLKVWNSEEDQ